MAIGFADPHRVKFSHSCYPMYHTNRLSVPSHLCTNMFWNRWTHSEWSCVISDILYIPLCSLPSIAGNPSRFRKIYDVSPWYKCTMVIHFEKCLMYHHNTNTLWPYMTCVTIRTTARELKHACAIRGGLLYFSIEVCNYTNKTFELSWTLGKGPMNNNDDNDKDVSNFKFNHVVKTCRLYQFVWPLYQLKNSLAPKEFSLSSCCHRCVW